MSGRKNKGGMVWLFGALEAACLSHGTLLGVRRKERGCVRSTGSCFGVGIFNIQGWF